MNEKEPPAERDFRSFVDFGTGEGRPPEDSIARFYERSSALASTVPIKVRETFMALDHDMSGGSDHLFLMEGLVVQAAAEVWAAAVILKALVAPLTMYHHARALYEAHAMMYWLLGDVHNRALRLQKDHLMEREGFEKAALKSIGEVESDIALAGKSLIDDAAVLRPPSVHDQGLGHPVLEFDYAMFWKYASAHAHPGSIQTGEIDPENERGNIMQIMAGIVRHAAGVYRHLTHHFKLDLGEAREQLAKAEDYARYRFEGAPVEPNTQVT